MLADLKKAFAVVMEFEKAHGRKIAATAVYLVTHPEQVHNAVAQFTSSLHVLLAGVS